jgi:hypothetical protein
MGRTTYVSSVKKRLAGGAMVLATSAAVVTLGAGTASAELTEISPDPTVSSRQAADVTGSPSTRDARRARKGQVVTQGEAGDSTKAVPGGKSSPFLRGWRPGPGIGRW